MSLVNDMLNDLEKRRSNQPQTDLKLDWLKSAESGGERSSSTLRTVLSTLVVVLFVGIVFTLYQQYQPQPAFTETALLADASNEVAVSVNDGVEAQPSVTSAVEPAPGVSLEVVELNPEAVAEDDDVTDQEIQANVAVAEPITESEVVVEDQVVDKPKVTEPVVSVKKSVPITLADRDREQVRQAKLLIRSGDISQAEQILKTFIDETPAVLSGELLASIYISQNRTDAAKNLADKLLEQFPGDIALLTISARVLVTQGEYLKAVELLQASSPAIVDHVDYYELLAAAAQKAQQFELSSSTYRQLLSFDSSRGSWWLGLGVASDYLQDQSLAVNAYQRALALPDLAPSLRQYANQRLASLSAP